jgi:hypothetical protein
MKHQKGGNKIGYTFNLSKQSLQDFAGRPGLVGYNSSPLVQDGKLVFSNEDGVCNALQMGGKKKKSLRNQKKKSLRNRSLRKKSLRNQKKKNLRNRSLRNRSLRNKSLRNRSLRNRSKSLRNN